MKTTRRLIQFRTQPETQKKEERSHLGKVAAVLGGAAVIGGFYAHNKSNANQKARFTAQNAERNARHAAEKLAAKNAPKVPPKPPGGGGGVAPKPAVNATPAAKPKAPWTAAPKAAAPVAKPAASAPAPKPAAPKPAASAPAPKPAAPKPAASAPAPKPAAPVAKPAQPASLLRPGEKGPLSSFAADRLNKIAIAARKAAAKSAPEQTVKIVANRKPAASAPSTPISAKTRAASDAVLAADIAKKAKAKKVKVKVQGELGLSAIHQKMINFQQRRYEDNTFAESTSALGAYRKASRVVPWIKRGSEAAGDIGDMASGKKVKDPFYKKSWFKNAATAAAIGAPILGSKLHRVGKRAESEGGLGNSLSDRILKKAANSKVLKKVSDFVPNGFSAKPNKLIVALKAHARLVEFATVDPLEKGWDLRDARGRSARVYAPGSKKRDRREKDWGEKTDNIRLVRNAAIVTAAGLGGLAIHQGLKLKKAPSAGDLANATKAGKAAGVAQQRNAWKKARKNGVEIVAPNDAFKKIKPRGPANAPVAMSARQVMTEFARQAREEEPAAQKVSRWVVPAATTLAAGATIAAALTTRKTAATAKKSAEAATAAATKANHVLAQNETSVKNVLRDAAKTSRNTRVITGAVANPIRRVKASAYLWKKRIGLDAKGKPIQFAKGALVGAVAGGLTGATAGVYSAARSGRKVSAQDDLRGVTVARPFAKKAYLPASHTGIGLPNGNIAHVVRAKGAGRGEGKYQVIEESFDKFAGGATVKARDGVAPKAALRARQAVGTKGDCYSTLGKNCEHVTSSIKAGRKEGVSKQVERGLAGAAVGAAVGGITGHLIQRKSK